MAETTFSKKIKDDPKDRLEVEVGDSKQPDFYPQLKIKRWDNEVNVSIRLKDDDYSKAIVEQVGDKVKWVNGKREAHFYETPEGSEFEVSLKEKPVSNVIEFTLVDKDVEYFYQPALTQKEIDDGAVRPDNVIGSYAIYAKSNKVNYVGGKEYKVGKIGHIYRPKIIDSAGTEVWGELHIENGLLSVTIPQDFLDNAVYPVRHAAGLTFGYESIGGTSTYNSGNYKHGLMATGAVGTADSISFYNRAYSSSYLDSIQYALFLNSDKSLVDGTQEGTTSATANWQTLTFTSPPAISAVDYWIVSWIKSYVYGYYDDGNSDGHEGTQTYATDGWNDPLTGSFVQDRKYSIYATYTAGGSATAASTMNMMGV